MTYKSLYRKYRPSKFEDVYGQKFIVKTLNNAIKNNKISHAYLFTGTRGTGKTTIAKIFAKMVNCINLENNLPCGNCEICLTENTDEIPDIIEIDAASNNGVDEIRELKNKIKLVPTMCKYKVYIIDEVHMLSTGAFNALLKTLEEPPSHVIFILATTDPQKLPITIISRCQRFDFKKISVNDIFDRLKYISNNEQINISDEVLMEIAKMSDGAMRDAIGTLDQLNSYSDNLISIDDVYDLRGTVPTNVLLDLINYYLNRELSEMLDIIEKIDLEGKSFNLIVHDMLMFFRNAFINKKADKYLKNKNIPLKEEICKISDKLDVITLQNIIMKFEELSKNIDESNYPRILFEIYLLTEFENITNNNSNTVNKNDINDVYSEKKKENKVTDNNINNIKEEKKDVNVTVDYFIESVAPTTIRLSNQISNKDILINNTIALATSKSKKMVQDAFINLDNYLIHEKYRNAATILKDSTVTAASDDHLLLTYKYYSMVESHDNDLFIIRELISKIINVDYKVVAITEEEWKQKRPYYLNKKKENGSIQLIDEVEEIITIKEEKEVSAVENLIDIFGSDIIEMEG